MSLCKTIWTGYMKEALKNPLEKLHRKGPHVLIYGLILISFYKIWKTVTFNMIIQPMEENLHYLGFEYVKTIYRIMATIIGLLVIKKYFQGPKCEFIKDNYKITIINTLIILPLFFLSRLWLFDFSFYSGQFSNELFFNLFTGSYEEIAFRGLILVGLAQYLKPLQSIFLSALLFSLWHYDVVTHPVHYLMIFVWGLYVGLCYWRGNNLLSLMVFHFLWDQIFFGFSWSPSVSGQYSENFVGLTEVVILAPFIWLLWRNNARLIKN